MPRARDRMAASANPGFNRSCRNPYQRYVQRLPAKLGIFISFRCPSESERAEKNSPLTKGEAATPPGGCPENLARRDLSASAHRIVLHPFLVAFWDFKTTPTPSALSS